MNATEYQSYIMEAYQRAKDSAINSIVVKRYSVVERGLLAVQGITEDSPNYEQAAEKLQADIRNAIESAIEGFRP